MNELFNVDARGDNGVPAPSIVAAERVIKPTPSLPDTNRPYAGSRRKRVADPIGLGGLPDTRAGLNAALLELCNRLAAAGGEIVSAHRLVEEMGLSDDRTLRLLLAYGHVHHRIQALVGIEGVGYCWGDLNPGAIRQAARIARRKGLCSMYLASLYSETAPVVQMVQMALRFRHAEGDGDGDELTAWMAAESVTPGKLAEAFVATLIETPEGVEALQAAARKRPGIFLDAETAERLRRQASGVLAALGDAKKTA